MKTVKYLLAVCVFLFSYAAWAAAVYTPVPAPNEYYKYEITTVKKEVSPTGVITTTTNVRTSYLLTTDLETVQMNYKRIGGVWVKHLSDGGSIRYFEQVVTVPPVVDECQARFVCHKSWGWIVDLTLAQVMKCPAVKITQSQALFFDSVLASPDGGACPVWPK